MRRAVIVHCWGGTPNYCWYPWAKAKLESEGFEVLVPTMPDTNSPLLEKWLTSLDQSIGTPDENLVLIGHSLGVISILRYLETLSDQNTVGKVVMVAGFTDQLGFKELENFFAKPIDFKHIKSRSKYGFSAIQSDNDPFVSNQYGLRLEQELGAKLIIKHGALHMSGPLDNKHSCIELSEVVVEAKSL